MTEDEFEISHDEYNEINVDEFIKGIMMHGLDPKNFQAEMHGSWYRKEEKKVPVCAASARERSDIIQRLYAAWMCRPELTLAQLVSMPFGSLVALFRSGDYNFIQAVETIKSLDHPVCEEQIEKDLAVARGLQETLARISHVVDSIEGILSDLGGD